MALDLSKLNKDQFTLQEEETALVAGESAAPESATIGPTLRGTMGQALTEQPDEYARTQQLSRQTGIPHFAVKADPAAVESKLRLDKIDVDSLQINSPRTAGFLADYNNAVIAQDDTGVLSKIESFFDTRAFEGLGASISLGYEGMAEGALLRGVDALPTSTTDLVPVSAMPFGMEDMAYAVSEDMARNLGINSDEELAQAKEGAVEEIVSRLVDIESRRKDVTPDDLNLLEQGVRAGIESLAMQAPGFAVMLASGGRAFPMLAMMGTQAYADSYGSARADGASPEKAHWYATVDAAIEVGTEILPTKTLEGILSGQAKGNLTKETLKFMVREMGTEQLATAGQSLNAYLFGLDEELENAQTPAEMAEIQLRRQAVTAIATVVAGGAQAVAGSAIGKSVNMLEERLAEADAQTQAEQLRIDEMSEAAQNSKLRERDPELFNQFIQRQDAESKPVFIDSAQLSLYLSGKSMKERRDDPVLHMLDERAREASDTQADVQISAAEFMTELAASPHFTELRPLITLTPESVAPFRMEQQKADERAYIDRMIDDAKQNVSEYAEAQQIFESVKSQLFDTGQMSEQNAAALASVVPAWATAKAKREGKTVAQVYQESGLRIEGPQTGRMAELTGDQILSQARESGYEGESRGEAEEWLRASQKGLDMSPEARKQRAQEMGFDTEQTYFHGTDANFNEFIPGFSERHGDLFGSGVYVTKDPGIAGSYAGGTAGANLMPVRIRGQIFDATTDAPVADDIADALSAYVNDNMAEGDRARVMLDAGADKTVRVFDNEEDAESFYETQKKNWDYFSGLSRTEPEFVESEEGIGVEFVDFNSLVDFKGLPSRAVFDAIQRVPGGAIRDAFASAGVDGVSLSGQTVVFDPKNLRSVNAAFDPDFSESANLLAQEGVPERNLAVTHNLSAENILAAADLGGLAAPSIATIRTDMGDFSSFGEVSLLADPSLLHSSKARTFDADVYSPRQPRAEYKIDRKALSALEGQNSSGLSFPDEGTLSSEGADALQRSPALQYMWLESVGRAPKKKKKQKVPAAVRKASALISKHGYRSHFELAQDPQFHKIAKAHYEDLLQKAMDADPKRGNVYKGFWFDDAGEVKQGKVDDLARTADIHFREGGFDLGQLRHDIQKKFRAKKTRNEFDQWATEQFNAMVSGKKLFKGFTDEGNRRYVSYTMDNVVREMTQQLQGGETSFYGAGNVRSAYANELKTLAQVKESRDKIVTEEEMDRVKEAAREVYEDAIDRLKPYYKFDADSYSYMDDAGMSIMQGRRGLQEAFNVNDEVLQIVSDLTQYLAALPTAYFETKIQRPVSFREFNTAVVPKGMRKDAMQVLRDAGLKIKFYDPSGKGKTRQQVISEQEGLLFQESRPDAVVLEGEGDVAKVQTGVPVTFHFIHNTESATSLFGKPKKGDQFGRDMEPSARYVTVTSKENAESAEGAFIGGQLTFNNPLVIANDGWKKALSEKYGKTGKRLSKALIADGYDGVITTEKRYISEVVDLTTFDEAKAMYQTKGPQVRGYYDPSNSLIRLTEASDLSTFLHEFAHFMYEQELVADGMMKAEIQTWFLRNKEDVAKEANDHLRRKQEALQQAAYHGTPHVFDKFSLDAIGTGEGAQAYGWGLYFAGKKSVAEWYRDALSGLTVNGRKAEGSETRAFSVLKDNGNDISAAVLDGRRELDGSSGPMTDILKSRQDVLESWEKSMPVLSSEGSLYQVDIPEDSELFDWDALIDEQPAGVLAKLQNAPWWADAVAGAEERADRRVENPIGRDVLDWLKEDYDPQEVSMLFNDAGIKGLRYLDGSSRGGAGESRNYVIWDESVVTIEAVNDELVQAENPDVLAQPPVQSQTDTPEFKAWFGDSKVVDENGDPLVVYHGSSWGFDSFNTEGGQGKTAGTGSFFSDNAAVASTYASGYDPNVMPVYVSLQNPAIFDAKGANWSRLTRDTKVSLPSIEVSDAEDLSILEALGVSTEGRSKTKKLKKRSTSLGRLFPDEFLFDDYFTTDDLARWARDQGYDGVIFKNVVDKGPSGRYATEEAGAPSTGVVAFKPEQIKSAIGNRGTFDPQSANILEQSPELPGLPEGSISAADVEAFVTQGTAGDSAKDSAIRVATHEQFARGFETYVMEGKAPSVELRNAFRKFAAWLAQIYRAIKGELKVKLDDDMRAVFDRLLATDEQIEMAKARAKFEPMFTDAAMAGMTEEQFAAYQEKAATVTEKAQETLRDQLVKEYTRQAEKQWKAELRDLTDEMLDSVNSRQVYVAAERLKNDLKLDKAAVKAMVGETITDSRGRKVTRPPAALRGMTIDGARGLHPDEAAALLGYKSGAEMLNDVMTAPSARSVAEAEAQAEMVNRHGDILNDGTIEARADEALANEERGGLLLAELKALSRGNRSSDKQALKDLVKERIGKLAYREIHPGRYRKAELTAAKESAAMLATGNREGAAAAKQRQVMNYYLGMAAQEARNEIDKIVTRMARYEKKKVREAIAKSGGGHLEQIQKILRRFEFRRTASLASVDRKNVAIQTWMDDRIQNFGDGLVLDPAVLDESFVTHWKNVPFADLRGIADSVKNIEHVARYANKINMMQDQIDYDTFVAQWTEHMDQMPTVYTPTRSEVNEDTKVIPWAMAQMTKIPFLASWLDGGDRVGMSHDVLVQPFADAHDAEQRLWEVTGSPVMDAIADRSAEDIARHGKKVYIPEIADTLTGQEILAVALNTGNAGNLRKLLLGEEWANPDNDAEISIDNTKLQAVLKHMTKSDWDLVQMIWDQMDLLYPQLAEVHRATTGIAPPKVEAVPVVTPFGEYKGGYYPVKYDPNRGARAAELQERLNAETESMFGSVGIQASVNAGATNERTGYYAPIRLSLDVVPNHFQETIHYITHHDAVRTVNRLIRDQRVANAIKSKVGKYEFQQLKPWLNDIAKDGREAPTKMYWERALARLRFGATLGYMGFKVSTGLMQLLGLSNTAAEVGSANLYRGLREVLGSTSKMQQAMEFAVEHSKVMRYRATEFDREVKNAMEKLRGKRGLLKTAQEMSMKHIALIQTYCVDLPSWHAAYAKELSQSGDEVKAAKYADWVVENVQGSGRTANMAAIMRNQNEANRMFTMFMTFFSSLWNIERDLARGAKSGKYSVTDVAARAALVFVVPVIAEMALRGELFPDDDDDETVAQKALTKMALYPVASMPFIRDIASGVGSGYGYNMTPIGDLMERGVKNVPALVEGALTDEEITRGQLKGSVQFLGAWFGVPGTSQVWATTEHLYQVIEDGEELTLKELAYGPDRK